MHTGSKMMAKMQAYAYKWKMMQFHNIFMYLILINTTRVLASNGSNYRYPGETSPERVEMPIGASVNISCRMHPAWFPGKNSSDLYFIEGPTQQQVPDKDIVILDESTIVFMLRNATEQQTSYQCRIGKEAIMESTVNVGTPPKRINDFDCRGYDYEYMLCNFTQPNNPVLTQYNLTFRTQSALDYSYQPSCNYELKPLVVCNITLPQKNNLMVEYYHFTLTAINSLDTRTQSFDVNLWNVMIFARPGNNFRVIEVTTNRLQVAWKMYKWSERLMKGLQWEIMLKPEGAGLPWLNYSDVPVLRAKNELRLRLNELPYAYYWYTLKLRMRVRSAVDPENMWSETFLYRFRTEAKIPDHPPRTDVGSFYVDATETEVRLYWEQLAEYQQNGANFSYEISEVKKDGKAIQLRPLKLELNSAVFEWKRNSHYEFSIKSSNHIGESPTASRIEIFPLTQRNYKSHTPRPIHNFYHAPDRTYTLTWEPPQARDNLQHYTVYWCYSKRALQNECKGSIHFKRLDKHETKFTTQPQSPQEEHTLNLAISANYLDYNTGMHWTPCTVDINSDLVKMEPEIQASSAASIYLQWSPESVCPSILEGYNLTYCEVDNSVKFTNSNSLDNDVPIAAPTCLHSTHTTIIDKNLKKFELLSLKPYTDYRVEMFMFSSMKVGKASDPLIVRTKEAAPSPPRQLQVSKITNTSATISWLAPSHPNGIIRYYMVILNNEKYHVAVGDEGNDDQGAKLVFELQNLTSFTAYKVYVVAHTVDSSDPSNDIHFTTLIGYPSMPSNAILVKDTNNTTIIQWSKPSMPAGRVEFYEVAVKVKRNDQIIRQRITAVIGDTSCALQIPSCVGDDYQTIFEVRAVNAALKTHEVAESDFYASTASNDEALAYDGNDDLSCVGGKTQSELQHYRDSSVYKLFKSPWQPGPTYGCAENRLSKITTIALVVIFLSLCIMGALYLARKKYNKMANIDCTLPPELDAYPTKMGIDNDILDKSDKLNHHIGKELTFHNEKYHLLASVGNDSGYLGEARTLPNGSLGGVIDGSQMPSYLRTASESSADSLVESTVESIELDVADSSLPTSSSNLGKGNSNLPAAEDYSMHILPVNNGYIKPTNIMNWPMSEELPTTSSTQQMGGGGGGYVTVGSLGLAAAPANVNGYVQPQALQKALHSTNSNVPAMLGNNGYTTLEDLGKQSRVVGQAERDTRAAPTNNAKPLISGYVTQRDLSVFGQQRLS